MKRLRNMGFCLLLFLFLSGSILQEALAGFTSGAPCSSRNTAILDVRGPWRFPRDPPDCVDITSMGKRSTVPREKRIHASTTLYADHMHLDSVPDFIFTLMPNLQLIDFSFNNLRGLSKNVFMPLRDLHTLLLANNRVVVPKRSPLLSSPSLKTLSLSNNSIRKVRSWTFRQLPALTVLYLDRNFLVHLNPNVFKPLVHLKYLHLGNNRLKMLPNIVLVPPKSIVIIKGNPLNGTDVIKR